MPLKKLGHVVLKVRDLDRSEAFYSDVVGLRVTGRLVGRMVFFSVPGNDDSHDLAVWKVGLDAAPQEAKQVGLFHVAWQVERAEDLERMGLALPLIPALARRLREDGIPLPPGILSVDQLVDAVSALRPGQTARTNPNGVH